MSNFKDLKEGDIIVIARKEDDVFTSISEGAYRLAKVVRIPEDGDPVLADSIKISKLSEFADRDIYQYDLVKLAYEHKIQFTSLSIEDLKMCRERAANGPDIRDIPIRIETYNILIKSYEKSLIRLESQLRRIGLDYDCLTKVKATYIGSMTVN